MTPHRFDCWLIYTKHEAGELSKILLCLVPQRAAIDIMIFSFSKLRSECQQWYSFSILSCSCDALCPAWTCRATTEVLLYQRPSEKHRERDLLIPRGFFPPGPNWSFPAGSRRWGRVSKSRLSHAAPRDGMGFLYLLNCMNLTTSLIIIHNLLHVHQLYESLGKSHNPSNLRIVSAWLKCTIHQ